MTAHGYPRERQQVLNTALWVWPKYRFSGAHVDPGKQASQLPLGNRHVPTLSLEAPANLWSLLVVLTPLSRPLSLRQRKRLLTTIHCYSTWLDC